MKLIKLLVVGSMLLGLAGLYGCGDTTASGGSCTSTITNNQPTDSNNTTTNNPAKPTT